MSLRRGDVVLIDVPFLTRPGSKIRPMLVVQADVNNARMANTILVTISTNVGRSHQPTQVLIDVRTPAGSQSGLLATSVVSCENLLTVRQSHVIRTIGRLPAELMRGVDEALKASLGLSQTTYLKRVQLATSAARDRSAAGSRISRAATRTISRSRISRGGTGLAPFRSRSASSSQR
jgi:mRNA interferase MazF